MAELKSKVVKGAAWQMGERLFGQVASFFVTLVLSRLLTPGDYGTVALLTIFLSVSGALVDCGLGMALVQKKEVTDLHFNSMFYANIVLATLCYSILFVAAPYVARFYDIPSLKWIMRVISLTIITGAVNSVQIAVLLRGLRFDLSFKVALITTASSSIAGIVGALCGLGPWALVLQSISAGLIGAIARWFVIAWRPKLMFSFKALGELFDFGWKIAAMSLINNTTNNLYGLIIGKRYSREDLAHVNKGGSLPTLLMGSISGTIIGVSFPALARMQDSRDRIRDGMSKMLQCSTFIVFPMMLGLCVCARDVMLLLFGSQWIPAVIYMQIICIQVAMAPACDVNGQGIAAVGRSDLFIPMQIIKSATLVAVMIGALHFGIFYFVLLQCCVCKVVEYVVNSWPNRKLFDYPIERQIKEIAPAALASCVMAAVVLGVHGCLVRAGVHADTMAHLIIRLLVQVLAGVIVYVCVSSLIRVRAFTEYASIIEPKLMRASPVVGSVLRRMAHIDN